MAKRKCWYKNIKVGDFVEVKFLEGHSSAEYYPKIVIGLVKNVHDDGCLHLWTVDDGFINIGFDGTDWAKQYPANIIRKVRGFDLQT